jgi:hypothetical protein
MGKSGDGNADGSSIFEHLTADPETEHGAALCRRWRTTLRRIVHRDRMYEYSQSLKPNSLEALGAVHGGSWVSQPFEAGAEQHWTPFWTRSPMDQKSH